MRSDLTALEFDGIRRLLERLAHSPYGQEAARNLEPAPNVAVAREMQRAVTAAREAIDACALPRMPAVPDIRAALRQAAQPGAALAVTALHNLRQVLHYATLLGSLVERYPGLYADARALEAPAGVVDVLERTLNHAGRLREDASPALAALHHDYHAARQQVEACLHTLIERPEFRGVFGATSRVHWHGARAVLTVRQAQAERIKGVRRGSGSGGRDVLIEPMEAVAHNNRLEALAGQIESQHQIVLRGVTDALRGELTALGRLVDAVTWIDLALAAGQLSASMNASPPELVDEAGVVLDRAYHPQLLLQFQDKRIARLQPLSIRLAEPHPMMVITGPNTGGKTVVLKTVGLLVTMAHCGLHLPSEGPCRIGSFERIIVDVGDRQSLHHHLSTFAGHVEVLKRLLAEADARTLVLLDELGTGTDPEEGAALAMAVLEELALRRVHGVVTTHLAPLKTFAQAHTYLCNASMRFDDANLTPTYELAVGEAGRSLGLIIAEKNGLPPSLIERARAHLTRIAKNHG